MSESVVAQAELTALVEKTPHLGYQYESNPLLLEPGRCAVIVACLPEQIIRRMCAQLTADPTYYAAGGAGRVVMAGAIRTDCFTVIGEADERAGKMRRKANEAWRLSDEALGRFREARKRAFEIWARAIKVRRVAHKAWELADEARARFREAWKRSDDVGEVELAANEARKRAKEAEERADEADSQADDAWGFSKEAEGAFDKAWRGAENAERHAGEARMCAVEVKARLEAMLESNVDVARLNAAMRPLSIDVWLGSVSNPIGGVETSHEATSSKVLR